MPTVFKTLKLVSWRYGRNTRGPCLVTIKKDLFFLFNAAAESVNCSLFLKKSAKTFLLFDFKKKLRQTHRKFTATFIGKIYWR